MRPDHAVAGILSLVLAFCALPMVMGVCNGTAGDILFENSQLGLSWIDSAGYRPILSSSFWNVTLFAPSNEHAVEILSSYQKWSTPSKGSVDVVTKPENSDLASALLYHAIRGRYSQEELLKAGSVNTLLGEAKIEDTMLTFSKDDNGELLVSGLGGLPPAHVIETMDACNGVLYLIDEFLLPTNKSSMLKPFVIAPGRYSENLRDADNCGPNFFKYAWQAASPAYLNYIEKSGIGAIVGDVKFSGTVIIPKEFPETVSPDDPAALRQVLYNMLPSPDCPKELMALGSANTVIGNISNLNYPMVFSKDPSSGNLTLSHPPRVGDKTSQPDSAVVNSYRVVCNKVVLLVDKLLPLPTEDAGASASQLASSLPGNIETLPPRRLTCNTQTYANLLETNGTRPGLEVADMLNNGEEDTSTAASTNGSPSNSTSATDSNDGGGGGGGSSSSAAAIAGGVVGGLVVLALLGTLIWKINARKKDKQRMDLLSKATVAGSGGSSPKSKYSPPSGRISPNANCDTLSDTAEEELHIVVDQVPLESWVLNTARVDLNSRGNSVVMSLGEKLEDIPSLLPLRLTPGEVKVDVDQFGNQIVLGRGAFGSVFRGTLRGCQPIAGKVLVYPGNEAERDFIREAEILQHVSRDKNIVQLYGITTVEDKMVLVMELMEGGDLRHALDNDPGGLLHWGCCGKDVALDIARGITALHACNVIHRDLKSKNVLLTSFSGSGTIVAKLGDVGTSAWLPSIGFLSAGKGVVGTLAWSAPEMLLGQRCDCKVDIYSFGMILYEIATGKLPTRGFFALPEVSERCPKELVDLIAACTQQDPALRPTAKEAYDRILQS